MWIAGEDLSQESNRITLNTTVKDQYGLPVPNVHVDHANVLAMREHGFAAGEKVYQAVGAQTSHRTPPYPSTHNMGTARMSERPEDGVVDKWGRTHDVKNLFISDGSVFTSSASANPTLTIVALAIRRAEFIAEQLRTQQLRSPAKFTRPICARSGIRCP